MPKFTSKVKQSKGDVSLASVMKKLENVNDTEIAAGFDDTPHSTARMGMATLAYIHQMGAPEANIVARPFMTVASQLDLMNIQPEDLSEPVEKYLYTKSRAWKSSLQGVADTLQRDIEDAFHVGNYTVKSNPTPLLDTHELSENVVSRVTTGKDKQNAG